MKENKSDGRNRKKHQFPIVKVVSKEMFSMMSNMEHSGEFAIDMAKEIWRLEKYMEKVRGMIIKEPEDKSNTIFDQMQRIKDVFKKYDIEVRDHTGEKHSDGMSVKVLHIEESNELPSGQLEIIETIQPSIYIKGKIASHGEVIVRKGK